jgi:hypothetical protein
MTISSVAKNRYILSVNVLTSGSSRSVSLHAVPRAGKTIGHPLFALPSLSGPDKEYGEGVLHFLPAAAPLLRRVA